MKHVAIGILAVMACGQAHAASEAAIMGLWARGDGKARVRIERCGSAICAVNTWIRPDVPDEKIGDRLVMNIAPRGGTLAGSIRSATQPDIPDQDRGQRARDDDARLHAGRPRLQEHELAA